MSLIVVATALPARRLGVPLDDWPATAPPPETDGALERAGAPRMRKCSS